MLRIIKVHCVQIGQDTFKDTYNTKDFNIPELEAYLRNMKNGAFAGIEIINDIAEAQPVLDKAKGGEK